jgi:hypothetical protein
MWVSSACEAAAAAVALDEAITLGLISAAPSYTPPAGLQLDMFSATPPAALGEDRHRRCKIHGQFYQPHCWHCKRARPDRVHKRASQG